MYLKQKKNNKENFELWHNYRPTGSSKKKRIQHYWDRIEAIPNFAMAIQTDNKQTSNLFSHINHKVNGMRHSWWFRVTCNGISETLLDSLYVTRSLSPHVIILLVLYFNSNKFRQRRA